MQQTERAAAIIDHMRMFGRKASEEAYSVDPYVTIQSALSLVKEQLRLAEINVVVNAPNSCSPVLGHQVQLEQVLLNLLTNAQDAIKSFASCDEEASHGTIAFGIANLDCDKVVHLRDQPLRNQHIKVVHSWDHRLHNHL